MPMDSKTFIARVAKQAGIDTAKATELTAAFASVLRDRASNLDSIAIPGFGNFVAIKHAEKIATDSETGKRTLLPPEIKIEFVASAMLKKQVAEYQQ